MHTFLILGDKMLANIINQRVREVRTQKKISQQKVSEYLGMKLSTYSQMERTGNISAERLKLIAKFLKVDYGYLIDGENSDLSSKSQGIMQDIEKQYIEKYGFLENFSNAELNYLKMISYLSKIKRRAVFEYAYKLLKNK